MQRYLAVTRSIPSVCCPVTSFGCTTSSVAIDDGSRNAFNEFWPLRATYGCDRCCSTHFSGEEYRTRPPVTVQNVVSSLCSCPFAKTYGGRHCRNPLKQARCCGKQLSGSKLHDRPGHRNCFAVPTGGANAAAHEPNPFADTLHASPTLSITPGPIGQDE